MLGFDRLRDVRGNVPLPVAMWLEHDPTAVCAAALALAAPWARWHYRLGEGIDVVLRGPRIEVVVPGGEKLGTARIHGFRSAGDFDALPRVEQAGPFLLPGVLYPVLHGFACDTEGQLARFRPSQTRGTTPGLTPRATAYAAEEASLDRIVARLGEHHKRAVWPIATFTVRTRDLLSALMNATGGQNARAACAFYRDQVIVWPQMGGDEFPLILSALHGAARCLGCARHDPRDVLARGTWCYAPANGALVEPYSRVDEPEIPLSVEQAAVLLGRSAAELAATRMPVKFADSPRVTSTLVRRAV